MITTIRLKEKTVQVSPTKITVTKDGLSLIGISGEEVLALVAMDRSVGFIKTNDAYNATVPEVDQLIVEE